MRWQHGASEEVARRCRQRERDEERAENVEQSKCSFTQFKGKTDGQTSLSKLPVVYVDMLFEDVRTEITESKFTAEKAPVTSDETWFDFAQYSSIEAFCSDPDAALLNLFQSALKLAQETTGCFQLLGGDNVSSHVYNDCKLAVFSDESYFAYSSTHRSKDRRALSYERNLLHPEKLRNVHLSVVGKNAADNSSIFACKGDYIYFHYTHDRFDDVGWGCAYRSLQTLYSWFLLQGYCNKPIPSIDEIQRILVKIGDKPDKFIGMKELTSGSRDWIGSFEVSYVLNKLIGIDSVILNIQSGDQITSKLEDFKNHFQVYGTPIMIGRSSFKLRWWSAGVHAAGSASEQREAGRVAVFDTRPSLQGVRRPQEHHRPEERRRVVEGKETLRTEGLLQLLLSKTE